MPALTALDGNHFSRDCTELSCLYKSYDRIFHVMESNTTEVRTARSLTVGQVHNWFLLVSTQGHLAVMLPNKTWIEGEAGHWFFFRGSFAVCGQLIVSLYLDVCCSINKCANLVKIFTFSIEGTGSGSLQTWTSLLKQGRSVIFLKKWAWFAENSSVFGTPIQGNWSLMLCLGLIQVKRSLVKFTMYCLLILRLAKFNFCAKISENFRSSINCHAVLCNSK